MLTWGRHPWVLNYLSRWSENHLVGLLPFGAYTEALSVKWTSSAALKENMKDQRKAAWLWLEWEMPLTLPAGCSDLAPHTILYIRPWPIWSWLASPLQAAFLVLRGNFCSQNSGTPCLVAFSRRHLILKQFVKYTRNSDLKYNLPSWSWFEM